MNAESEMAGADGLGAETRTTYRAAVMVDAREQIQELVRLAAHAEIGLEVYGPLRSSGNAANLDPCAQIAESVGYFDEAETDQGGGLDALIDYKNALESALRSTVDAESALTQCQHIAYDGTLPYTEEQIKADKHLWMLDKIRDIAEGGKADPEFIAMLAAAERVDAAEGEGRR